MKCKFFRLIYPKSVEDAQNGSYTVALYAPCETVLDSQGNKLVGIINSKIKDARLIKLIWKLLKAGYCEDWQYHMTYSGTPQGGICSPIFANIYLHELDKFVVNLAKDFDRPQKRSLHQNIRRLPAN